MPIRESKILTIVTAILLSVLVGKAEAQSKPNILWLVIEDTSPQFIGCYGDANAKTPNIDKLAKGGVRFTHAFSTGTVCSPSRSTIITGARTFEMGTGNHRSYYPIPDFIKGFPTYMRQVGYYTTNNAKADYNTSSQKKIIAASWDESSDKAGWWNRKKGEPFFAVFNFMDSHQSRTMTNPYDVYSHQVLDELPMENQIADTAFDVPPRFKDNAAMRHQLARIYNGISLTDLKIGNLINRLKEDNLLDSTIIFFYADHGEGMPGAKTNGIDLGYRVPFIIWFPEAYKHLSPWATAGGVSNDLIDFADLAPTLLGLAGAEIPAYMHGRNLLQKNTTQLPQQLFLSSDGSEGSAILDRTITNGKFTYTRAFMPFMPQMFFGKYFDFSEILQEMRKDYKIKALSEIQQDIFIKSKTEYLFNIEEDKWQTKNLAYDKKYRKFLKKMRQDVKDSIIRNRDVMFLPAYELDQISKYTTPYEYRKNNAEYPISDIYAAASFSGIPGVRSLKKQMELLQHPNKIVRYWAAIGLKCRGKEIASYKEDLIKSLDDPYKPVQIILASICSDLFADNAAKTILNAMLNEKEEPSLELLALQMLMYQENNKEFISVAEDLFKQKNLNADVRDNTELFLYVTTGRPLKYENFW